MGAVAGAGAVIVGAPLAVGALGFGAAGIAWKYYLFNFVTIKIYSTFIPRKAVGAVAGAGAVIIGAPVVVGAMGFGAAGIGAGSMAAGMMSSAAIANGGGIAAGT